MYLSKENPSYIWPILTSQLVSRKVSEWLYLYQLYIFKVEDTYRYFKQ